MGGYIEMAFALPVHQTSKLEVCDIIKKQMAIRKSTITSSTTYLLHKLFNIFRSTILFYVLFMFYFFVVGEGKDTPVLIIGRKL